MGQKLKELYDLILEKEGLGVKMRTAMIARIPSVEAMNFPDTRENIDKVKDALRQARGVK